MSLIDISALQRRRPQGRADVGRRRLPAALLTVLTLGLLLGSREWLKVGSHAAGGAAPLAVTSTLPAEPEQGTRVLDAPITTAASTQWTGMQSLLNWGATPAPPPESCALSLGDWCARWHQATPVPWLPPPRGTKQCLWNCTHVGVRACRVLQFALCMKRGGSPPW